MKKKKTSPFALIPSPGVPLHWCSLVAEGKMKSQPPLSTLPATWQLRRYSISSSTLLLGVTDMAVAGGVAVGSICFEILGSLLVVSRAVHASWGLLQLIYSLLLNFQGFAQSLWGSAHCLQCFSRAALLLEFGVHPRDYLWLLAVASGCLQGMAVRPFPSGNLIAFHLFGHTFRRRLGVEKGMIG